jgi:hypothetical protein
MLSFFAMPFIYGLILLALGISLVVVWWSPVFVAVLQVLLVGALLLWGSILALVGYSEMKARREFNESVSSGDTTDTARPTSGTEVS